MDTLIEEPSTLETPTDTPTTPADETVTDDTSEAGTDNAATLQKRLADKDRYIKQMEADRKKAEKAKGEPITRGEFEEATWEQKNEDRITIVKNEFDKILVEGYQGEKVSKKIALELAEKVAKIDTSGMKRNRQSDMTQPSQTIRNAAPTGYETEEDKAIGLTVEKKRKLEERHPHLKGE
jgi:hypothetical protein